MNQEAKDAVIRARVALQKSHPFFSYIALHLTMIETEDVPTMGVDSKANCYYNAKFVLGLKPDELKGVICHETMHIVLEHLKNLRAREPKLSNVAQDICINDILDSNQLALPKEGLIVRHHEITLPTQGKPITVKNVDKKPWEQVYDEIYKQLPPNKGGGGAGDSFDIHIRDAKDGGASGKGEQKDGDKIKGAVGSPTKNGQEYPWKQVVNEGYAYAKLQGKAPAGVDRLIDELNYPKLNWREMLQKFIVREIPYDFNYMRPSKKSVSTGVYLPSVYRESLEICIGVDTSGSMSPKDLQDCLSETLGIVRAFSSVKLTVISCDADVHTIGEVNSEEDILGLKLQGGGGTDFKPVFKWVSENKPTAKLLIFFTDGYGDFPEDASIKTLWCITEGGIPLENIPFGERVYLDLKKGKEGENE